MYCENLASLGDWNSLTKVVQGQFDSYDEVWERDLYQDVLFPFLMHGETRMLLDGKIPTILEPLQNWLLSTEKASYLRSNFPEELTMICIANKELINAKLIAEKSVIQFLGEWANMDVLSESLRRQKLAKIRIMSELRSSIDGIDGSVADFTKLYEITPTVADSTTFWDTLVTYRHYLCRHTNFKAHEASLQTQKFALFSAALSQNNFGFCQSMLRDLRDESDEYFLLDNQLRLTTKTLNDLCVARKGFETLAQRMTVKVEAIEGLAEIGKILFDLSKKETFDENHEIFRQYGVTANAPREFLQKAIGHLTSAELLHETDDEKKGEICRKIAELSLMEFKDTVDADERTRLQKQIIQYSFTAMEHENVEARQIFPRILQLPGLNDADIAAEFNACIARIPEWMFLTWTPQIISRLNLCAESYLDPLIERLAGAYPNAFIYPLRLTIKTVNNVRPFLSKILSQLETPPLQKFIQSMHLLVLPYKKLKHHIQSVQSLIAKGGPELANIGFKIQEILDQVFGDKESHGSEYKIIYKYEAKIRNLLQFRGKFLLKSSS